MSDPQTLQPVFYSPLPTWLVTIALLLWIILCTGMAAAAYLLYIQFRFTLRRKHAAPIRTKP